MFECTHTHTHRERNVHSKLTRETAFVTRLPTTAPANLEPTPLYIPKKPSSFLITPTENISRG